jgi:hypothetical protein
MQADQRRYIFKACAACGGLLTQDKGFIVAADGLEDRRALAIDRLDIEREPHGTIHVGQSIVKLVEGGACSSTGDESPWVGGRVAHELFRNLLCPKVISNAADDQPAQRDQLDETRSR